MKLCYFLTDRHGPGNLRSLLPGEQLERQYGWEIYDVQTLVVVKGHLKIDADIYVMQRQTHKALPTIVRDMVELQGKCVVGECDDWFLGLSTMQDIGSHATAAYYQVMPKIFSRCTGLSVSTPTLRDGYVRYNREIEVIENAIDASMWEHVHVPESPRIRVGWMGGSGWHLRDLGVLEGVLGPWLRAHPEVDFVAAGDPTIHDRLGVPLGQRVSFETVPFSRLPEITATMDIGLVPLADSKFNDAKSYLKGLEYAACGIPCIASPTAEYRRWVDHGVNGFLADWRAPSWHRYLDLLVDNAELRRCMGVAARKKAEQHTIQIQVQRWHDFYVRMLALQRARNEGRTLNLEFTLLDLDMLDEGCYE